MKNTDSRLKETTRSDKISFRESANGAGKEERTNIGQSTESGKRSPGTERKAAGDAAEKEKPPRSGAS